MKGYRKYDGGTSCQRCHYGRAPEQPRAWWRCRYYVLSSTNPSCECAVGRRMTCDHAKRKTRSEV